LGRDKAARQHALARSVWFTVPGTFAVLAMAYAAVPPLSGMGESADRLVLALRWLVVAALPYAATCLTILYLRYDEGAHNPLAGRESERLRVHCRTMQNTLEQLVWFGICILALATYLAPAAMRVVPILCVMFAIARFIYWWGYLRGETLGRAPGVQITFAINIPLMTYVLVQSLRALTSAAD
jgi:uncharacterized membrane protein YecN with MAPEG domain